MNVNAKTFVYVVLLRVVVVFLLGWGVLACSWDVHAETTVQTSVLRGKAVPWKQALVLLRQHLPSLLLARKRLQGQKKSARQAGAFPNPSISYRREQLFPQQGQDEAGVQINIPLGASPWRQKDVAMARVRVQSWSVKLLLLRHSFRFLRDYFNLLHRVKRLRILEQSFRRFQGIERIVKVRVQEGKLPGAYRLRLLLEMRQRESQIERLKAQMEQQGRQLGYRIGQRDVPVLPQGSLVPSSYQLPAVTKELLDKLPPLQHAKAQSRLAKEQRRLAYARAWPNLQLALGYLHSDNTSQNQQDGHGFYLGISVPLPFFQRNQYRTQQALQSLRVARYKITLLLQQYRYQMEQSQRQLRKARSRLTRYQANVSGQIRSLLRSAKAAFVGGTSVQAYLDMQLTAERLQLYELSLQKDIRQFSLQLHQLMGRIPRQ